MSGYRSIYKAFRKLFREIPLFHTYKSDKIEITLIHNPLYDE